MRPFVAPGAAEAFAEHILVDYWGHAAADQNAGLGSADRDEPWRRSPACGDDLRSAAARVRSPVHPVGRAARADAEVVRGITTTNAWAARWV